MRQEQERKLKVEENQNSILLALRQIIQEVSTKSSFEDTVTTLVDRIRSTTHAALYIY